MSQSEESQTNTCPFCNLNPKVEIISETATAVAFFDGYPVSKGHTLIIPKRHVADYFELSVHEQRAMCCLSTAAKQYFPTATTPTVSTLASMSVKPPDNQFFTCIYI